LAQIINDEDTDYIMFMIHSSELMPGGSPYYQTAESIECLYYVLEELFSYLVNSYNGVTLGEYYKEKKDYIMAKKLNATQ
jgi:hypothetical protein